MRSGTAPLPLPPPLGAEAREGVRRAERRAVHEGGIAAVGPVVAAAVAGLRGKVVLVDFWTFTCVNWLRTLPYLRAWNARYKDRGLVVIGVHTPEFSVEHETENIRRAAQQMRVDYPIAVDNDYAVWRAFDNAYWPAVYIADSQGRIRYRHFGEGEYEMTEKVIQQLLREAGATGVGSELSPVDARGTEVAADWSSLMSGETYVGYEKAENFASPGGADRDRPHAYAVPAKWTVNRWALAGEWTVGREIAGVPILPPIWTS